MDFEKISDEILAIDPVMRYVRFIGEKGELMHEKVQKGKTLLQDQEGLGRFSTELPIMKQMHQIFDEPLGAVRFMHVVRDKVHQFVYYVDDVIIYTTCEQNTDRHRIAEIVNMIDSILQTRI